MKTLYLHIGMQKTATSAIQKFLYDNRALLMEKGFKYDRMPFVYDGYSRERNATFLYKYLLNEEGKPDHEVISKRRNEGLDIVSEWFGSSDNVILTDETLWLMLSKPKRRVFEELSSYSKEHGFNVKIVVYQMLDCLGQDTL